jgi:hypothetical protein
MSSKYFVSIVIGLAVVLFSGVLLLRPASPEPTPHTNQAGNTHELVAYKSATCGCCGNWVAYMKGLGYQVEVIDTEELDQVKQKYEVPESLYSCHTTIINDGQYFVEGHIPEEAIAKLMNEEPAIKGIGMPGMPSASPGMPGKKTAPFEISQVSRSDEVSQYMSI